MVFPDKNYVTFTIDSKTPANFTFPIKTKKDMVRCREYVNV